MTGMYQAFKQTAGIKIIITSQEGATYKTKPRTRLHDFALMYMCSFNVTEIFWKEGHYIIIHNIGMAESLLQHFITCNKGVPL